MKVILEKMISADDATLAEVLCQLCYSSQHNFQIVADYESDWDCKYDGSNL